jgi:hypothetical protein
MAEEGANAFWPSGEAAHVVDDSLLELPLAAGALQGDAGHQRDYLARHELAPRPAAAIAA